MDIASVKLQLISLIAQTQDENLLVEISQLVRIGTKKEHIYQLSEEQERAIQVAEDQIAKGEYLSHEEAKKQSSKWLED